METHSEDERNLLKRTRRRRTPPKIKNPTDTLTISLPSGYLGIVFHKEKRPPKIAQLNHDSPLHSAGVRVGMVVHSLELDKGTKIQKLSGEKLTEVLEKTKHSKHRKLCFLDIKKPNDSDDEFNVTKKMPSGNVSPNDSNKNAIHRVETTDEQWREYVKTHTDIGLFTLIWMHYKDTHKSLQNRSMAKIVTLIVRMLLFLTILAQWMIPIVLFVVYLPQYDEGLCPALAPPLRRILSFGICSIYVSRLSFLVIKCHMEGDDTYFLNEGQQEHLVARLVFPITLDRFMTNVYQPLVYILNIMFVFLTEDELEMVLNALALEFILKLSSELKVYYFSIFSPDIKAYRKENTTHLRQPSRFVAWVVERISLVGLWMAVPVFLFLWIYIPFCKI